MMMYICNVYICNSNNAYDVLFLVVVVVDVVYVVSMLFLQLFPLRFLFCLVFCFIFENLCVVNVIFFFWICFLLLLLHQRHRYPWCLNNFWLYAMFDDYNMYECKLLLLMCECKKKRKTHEIKTNCICLSFCLSVCLSDGGCYTYHFMLRGW